MASDSMDFVFSLKSFLEEFKSMNYYCLFALTVKLPEANMILRNGQQYLRFLLLMLAKIRGRTEPQRTSSGHGVGQSKSPLTPQGCDHTLGAESDDSVHSRKDWRPHFKRSS